MFSSSQLKNYSVCSPTEQSALCIRRHRRVTLLQTKYSMSTGLEKIMHFKDKKGSFMSLWVHGVGFTEFRGVRDIEEYNHMCF
jgi:hypothetical protein